MLKIKKCNRYTRLAQILSKEPKLAIMGSILLNTLLNLFALLYLDTGNKKGEVVEGLDDYGVKIVKLGKSMIKFNQEIGRTIQNLVYSIPNNGNECCSLCGYPEKMFTLQSILKDYCILDKLIYPYILPENIKNVKCNLCIEFAIEIMIWQFQESLSDAIPFNIIQSIFLQFAEFYSPWQYVFLVKISSFLTHIGVCGLQKLISPTELCAILPGELQNDGDPSTNFQANYLILEYALDKLPKTQFETILEARFQCIDIQLSILRLSRNKDEGCFLDNTLYCLHSSIKANAFKIFHFIIEQCSTVFHIDLIGKENFRDFYTSTLANAAFMENLHKFLESLPIKTINVILKYTNEAYNLFIYLGMVKEAHIMIQYSVLFQAYLKKLKNKLNKELFIQVIIHKYQYSLHLLLSSYCENIKDKKSIEDCLKVIEKSNETYSNNTDYLKKKLYNLNDDEGPILTNDYKEDIEDELIEISCIEAYAYHKVNNHSKASQICEMLIHQRLEGKQHNTLENWILACKINIVSTKIMRSIGYATEILEQIKRLVWALNSVVGSISNEPKNIALTTYFRSSLLRHSLINNCNDSHLYPFAVLADSYIPFSSKFRIVSMLEQVIRNAACTYERYGMVVYADYYIKQALKSPYLTLQSYMRTFLINMKISTLRYTTKFTTIKNNSEHMQFEKKISSIDSFITRMILLHTNSASNNQEDIQVVLDFILPAIPRIGEESIFSKKILWESWILILEYLLKQKNCGNNKKANSQVQQIVSDVILPNFITMKIKSFRVLMSLVEIYKELHLDYSKILKEALKGLHLAQQPAESLNNVLKCLFKYCVEQESTSSTITQELSEITTNLTAIMSTISQFTKKEKLLCLLYETVNQLNNFLHKRSNSNFYLVAFHIGNFVFEKGKFFNLYSITKHSSLLILDLFSKLSMSDIFGLDSCSLSWYPCIILISSIGNMHSTTFQHSILQKEIRNRKSLDCSKQIGYYKFSLKCFETLNQIIPPGGINQRKRSSLEKSLTDADEGILLDYGIRINRNIKDLNKSFEPFLDEKYTIIILSSNLAELSVNPGKQLELYMIRIAGGYDPIFTCLSGLSRDISQCFLAQFSCLINEYYEIQKKKDKGKYWDQCFALNSKLKEILEDFETSVLKQFKVVLIYKFLVLFIGEFCKL